MDISWDYKEKWVPKNWCFWTVVLEKTLESLLQRSNQSILNEISPDLEVLNWKDWCWSWNSNTLVTWCEELIHWRRPWCLERLKTGEGDNRGWDGWMASTIWWTWVWATPGVGDGQGSVASCSPWDNKELDMTESLNWTHNNLWIQWNLYQTTNMFFTKLEQILSQFLWKHKKLQIAKAILRKKNGTGRTKLSDFRPYCKATVIQTVWYWHKDWNIDQWYTIESPEINPHTYGHLIFEKGGKNIQ